MLRKELMGISAQRFTLLVEMVHQLFASNRKLNICLFACGLFNDIVSNSDYIDLQHSMIGSVIGY
jgi:hypothetical protein